MVEIDKNAILAEVILRLRSQGSSSEGPLIVRQERGDPADRAVDVNEVAQRVRSAQHGQERQRLIEDLEALYPLPSKERVEVGAAVLVLNQKIAQRELYLVLPMPLCWTDKVQGVGILPPKSPLGRAIWEMKAGHSAVVHTPKESFTAKIIHIS